jgi:hypothetical protein
MISKATKNADIYTNENSVVMYLQAKKYKVTVDVEYEDYGMPRSATVVIEPSDEPVTESLRDPNLAYHYNPWSAYYKFGGFPVFIQNPVAPCTNEGKPYDYICTINNHWGDDGNGNVFALINDGVVEDVYIEANCA